MSAAETSPVQYFERYGLNALVHGLLKSFNAQSNVAAVRARPFRVCLSLMDRWEIGSLVVPRIFRPAMESVYRYQSQAPTQDSFFELLRSASVFFDAIQSNLIWKEMISLIAETLDKHSKGEKGPDHLELIWFIVSNFNIREEEMLIVHIPNALVLLAQHLVSRFWDQDFLPKNLSAPALFLPRNTFGYAALQSKCRNNLLINLVKTK